jgi:hypothetical protein
METIFTEIENLCKEKFDKLWIKEVDRITTDWRRFLLYTDTRSKDSSTSKYRTNDYDHRFDDFAKTVLYTEREQPLTPLQRGHVRNFAYTLISIEKKGIEKYLEDNKVKWYREITFKLNKYLKKLLLESDIFISGKVSISRKGYVINVELKRHFKDLMRLETNCFAAGGNNIQCFHYRYIGSVRQKRIQ